jgi:hypothetical protein
MLAERTWQLVGGARVTVVVHRIPGLPGRYGTRVAQPEGECGSGLAVRGRLRAS